MMFTLYMAQGPLEVEDYKVRGILRSDMDQYFLKIDMFVHIKKNSKWNENNFLYRLKELS